MEELENERASLVERCGQQEARLIEKNASLQAARDEAEQWEERCQVAEGRIRDMEAEAVEMSDKLSRHSRQLSSGKAALWRSQQSETQLATAHEAAAVQLQKAQSHAMALGAKVDDLSMTLSRTQRDAAAREASLSEDIAKHMATQAELKAVIEARDRTEQVLSSQIEELNATIRRADAEHEVVSQRANTLQSQLDAKTRDHAALLESHTAIDGELTSVLKQRASLQTQLSQAKATLEEQAGRIAELEERERNLSTDLKRRTQAEATLGEREKHLTSKLKEVEANEQVLKQKLETLASPLPKARMALQAVNAFAAAGAGAGAGAGNGADSSTAMVAMGNGAGPRTPGSPAGSAPKPGGLFHLAYSHPSRAGKRYQVYRAIFEGVDTDHSGTVSLTELKTYIENSATRKGFLESRMAGSHTASSPSKAARITNTNGDGVHLSSAGSASDGAAGTYACACVMVSWCASYILTTTNTQHPTAQTHTHTLTGGLSTALIPSPTKRAPKFVADAHTRARFCRFFTHGRGGLDSTFHQYDTDGNGVISWEEFKVLADEVFLPNGLSTALDAEERRKQKRVDKKGAPSPHAVDDDKSVALAAPAEPRLTLPHYHTATPPPQHAALAPLPRRSSWSGASRRRRASSVCSQTK